MKKEVLRAALYIRVSTDDQTEYSPAAQKKALIEYAKKNNMEVIPEFIFADEGFSGRNADKRPNFMRMIGIAKTKPKPFDVILVHKFDRFARNREDSIVYKSMLKKQCKIRVVSITESLDEEDKMSGLIEAILEAMAEYYSINLAEEVKKGMTEKARMGGFQTSPPLGYTVGDNNVLKIMEQEAEYVRFIFNQYVEHDKGPSQITRQLTNMGIMSKRGNPIDRRNIEYILQNPIYAGKVRWTPTERVRRNFKHPDTIIAESNHEPIISEDLFQKAIEKMDSRKKMAKPKERPLHECKHWLSGLVKCSNCGKTLVSSRNPDYLHFQCRGYNTATCNISHSISITKLEKAIVEELNDALVYCESSGFQLEVTRFDSTQDEIDALQKQLNKMDARMLRANEAYLAQVYTLDEYKKYKVDLEQQKQNLAEEIEVLTSSRPTVADNSFKGKIQSVIDIIISDCETTIKQKAIRSIIDKIIFNRPHSSIEVYYHDA